MMIEQKCVIFIFTISLLPNLKVDGSEVDYSGYKVYTIIPEHENDTPIIEKIINDPNIDVWTSSRLLGLPTVAMVPPLLQGNFNRMLDQTNLTFKISIDNVQMTIDREKRQQRLGERAAKALKTSQKFGISFTKYYRFSQINDYLNYLHETYPNLTEIINIGLSYEGRKLNVIKISSSKNSNKKKPAILVEGGIHAREWIAPAQVLFIIHQLVENHAVTQSLIEDVDWYLIPSINPDGYEYTHTQNRFWRKTRSRMYRYPCLGVDGNRNFGFKWKPNEKCNDVYPGRHSFTELEMRALAQFGLKIRNQLKLYLTFHSFGQYILYPWSYTTKLPKNANELNMLGQNVNMALDNQYTVGSVTQVLYPAFGSSLDWFRKIGVNLCFCIELPPHGSNGLDGFDLPPFEIKPTVTHIFKGVQVLAKYVQKKYVN